MNKSIKIFIFILLALLIIYFLHFSFLKQEPVLFPKRNNVVAMVDGYKITLEDYLAQKAKYAPFYKDAAPANKNAIIETLISDIILLKEAEKLKMNQDRAFLKGIEYFWRQSLIEGLLKKKNSEIKEQVKFSEEEIKNVFEIVKKEYHLRLIQLSVDKSDFKMDLDKIDDAFLKSHPEYILYDSGLNWMDLKSLEPQLRHQLFSMAIPLNKWFFLEDKKICYLFFIDEIRENPACDYQAMKSEIQEIVQEDKEKEALDNWLKTLEKKSKIIMNTDLFSKI